MITDMVWIMQAYYIMGFTGQDLPIGIVGVHQEHEYPRLHLYVPEPSPVITVEERNVLFGRAVQTLYSSNTSLKEGKKQLIENEVSHFQERIRNIHPSLLLKQSANEMSQNVEVKVNSEPEKTDVTDSSSSYPLITVDFVPEDQLNHNTFEEAVQREAVGADTRYLGICTFNTEAEREIVSAKFHPEVFATFPKDDIIDYLHPKSKSLTEEVQLRHAIIRLKNQRIR